jgi:hypothetical protein
MKKFGRTVASLSFTIIMGSTVTISRAEATTGSWSYRGAAGARAPNGQYKHFCWLSTYRSSAAGYLSGDNEQWYGCYSDNTGDNPSYITSRADGYGWDEARAAAQSGVGVRNDGSPRFSDATIRQSAFKVCENVWIFGDRCGGEALFVGPFT